MAETHIIAHFAIPFIAAIWWTKSWLMDPIISRWRFAVSGLTGSILWVYLAFTATRAVEGSAGIQIVYGSIALAYLCGFLALVSVAATFLGLAWWTEEAGSDAVTEARRRMSADGIFTDD